MKIKRFNNLWTMGLILFGALLLVFYIVKTIFPQFIIGIAEMPSIVKFGNYVDTHIWANLLFSFVVAYLGGYIYYCACYRKRKLDLIENLVLIGFTLLSFLFQYVLTEIYAPYNYVVLILQPFIVLCIKKDFSSKYLVSLCVCFTVDIMSQALSLSIRNIVLMSTQLNSATMFILMIDGLIWRVLLYLFFNNKKVEKEM